MNTQVYFHRVRRIYDYYLCQYFTDKGSNAFDSAKKILDQTDIQAMTSIINDADAGTGGAAKWARRIRDRNHHRIVHETGEDASAMDLRHSGRLLAGLQQRFPNVEFIHDVARKSIHDLLLPEDTDATGL